MRRMLFGFAIGLLTFASSAWAEGPIVRWDRIEGVQPTYGSDWVIGDENQSNRIFSHPTRWSAGRGRAMVNLETGFVSFQVEGLVFSDAMTGNAIGSNDRLSVIGTVVCNAGKIYPPTPWVIEYADTDVVWLEFGTGSFQGFIAIPPNCLEKPKGIAFLIRRPLDVSMHPGDFIAFGAGRTLQ